MFIRILLISIFSSSSFSGYNFQAMLDYERSEVSQLRNEDLLDTTRDALLSYEYIRRRSDYLIFKLQNSILGDYSSELMVLAPLVTGNIELNAFDMNIYYNHHASRAGVRYSTEF